MAEELSLDGIKDMKKAEFIKAFKNKAAWKKAKAVIILVDYKLEGKKAVIAIPFKKENEMKLEMKRLKKEKLHLLKKSGGGTIKIEVGADGQREAKIELGIGGLKPELLLLKANPLFERIKLRIQATQNEEAMADAAASESEVDANENLPEDSLDDVAVDESPEVAESAEPETEEADNSSTIEELKSLASRIGSLFKDTIQPIANAIKGNSASQEHLNQTNETSDLIDRLKEKFESASEEVKSQVSSSVNKILGLVPSLDKIKTALGNVFRGNSNESNANQEGPINEVKNLLKEIADKFKQSIQAVVVPAIKNNSANNKQKEQVETLIQKINELKQKVTELSEAAKASIDANFQKILGLLPNLEKIKEKINSIISSSSNSRQRVSPERINALPENPNQHFIEELLNNMEQRIGDLNTTVDGIENSISNTARTVGNNIARGAQLVGQLFQ
jgi:methyl-accepting chemotaxis protein